jgi:16S rRNA (uracil1498-N3)-methyltransferase
MESIYLPDFNGCEDLIRVTDAESKHLKVLHTRINDKIMVTNGKGLSTFCTVVDNSNFSYMLKADETNNNIGENTYTLDLALALMDNKDRFEFALEKSVELGINNFIPINSKYSANRNINYERLRLKSIAALKQCKRSVLPNILQLMDLNDLIKISTDYDLIVLADEDGNNYNIHSKKIRQEDIKILLIVGPEGGFDTSEVDFLKSLNNTILLKLGNRRLRAETAVVTALSIINSSLMV